MTEQVKLTDKFKRSYFRVKNFEQSSRVQKLLFSLGYMWIDKAHGDVRQVLAVPRNGFIYVDKNGRMLYSGGDDLDTDSSIVRGFTPAAISTLESVADLWKKDKTKKRKESRKRAKLRKQGWIINTGVEPYVKGEIDILFFDGSTFTSENIGWAWSIQASKGKEIQAYRPVKVEGKVITFEEMTQAIAADIGKELVVEVQPDTNPKRQYGVASVPLNMWSPLASAYGALGLYNGALKYGKANFANTPVEASIYIAAAMRHLSAWASGQEDDPADGVPNLGGVLANIAILLEARAAGMLIDDRLKMEGYLKELDLLKDKVKALNKLHEGKDPKHYTREG